MSTKNVCKSHSPRHEVNGLILSSMMSVRHAFLKVMIGWFFSSCERFTVLCLAFFSVRGGFNWHPRGSDCAPLHGTPQGSSHARDGLSPANATDLNRMPEFLQAPNSLMTKEAAYFAALRPRRVPVRVTMVVRHIGLEIRALLRRMCEWLNPGGLVLGCIKANGCRGIHGNVL